MEAILHRAKAFDRAKRRKKHRTRGRVKTSKLKSRERDQIQKNRSKGRAWARTLKTVESESQSSVAILKRRRQRVNCPVCKYGLDKHAGSCRLCGLDVAQWVDYSWWQYGYDCCEVRPWPNPRAWRPPFLSEMDRLIKKDDTRRMKKAFYARDLEIWRHLENHKWGGPVRYAIKHGNKKALQFFLAKGLWDPAGIMLASAKSHRIGCLKLLLRSSKARIDECMGDTCLSLEISWWEAPRIFGDRPNWNRLTNKPLLTPLHLAAANGSCQNAKALVRASKWLRLPPSRKPGEKPHPRYLPRTSYYGFPDSARFETPLAVACQKNNLGVAKFLLQGEKGDTLVDRLTFKLRILLPTFSDDLVRLVAEFTTWPGEDPNLALVGLLDYSDEVDLMIRKALSRKF